MAKIISMLTENQNIQQEVFHIDKAKTFYSSVISHSYYCIFYSAKAYLLKQGIKISPPEEHKKSFLAFKKLVEDKVVDAELLKLYEEVMIKAETLLGIFKTEKKKRGEFTYKTLPQANKKPAQESLRNSQTFFKHIYKMCQ